MLIIHELIQKAARRSNADKIFDSLSEPDRVALMNAISEVIDEAIQKKYRALRFRNEDIDANSHAVARAIMAACIAQSLALGAEQLIQQFILPEDPITADLLIRGFFSTEPGLVESMYHQSAATSG